MGAEHEDSGDSKNGGLQQTAAFDASHGGANNSTRASQTMHSERDPDPFRETISMGDRRHVIDPHRNALHTDAGSLVAEKTREHA